MNTLRKLVAAIAVAAAYVVATPALAAVSFYTDLGDFLAAAGPTVVEDFEDAMLNPGLTITGPNVDIA